jgi:hypothetical protein
LKGGFRHATLTDVISLYLNIEVKPCNTFECNSSNMLKIEIMWLDSEEHIVTNSVREASFTNQPGNRVIVV